MAEVRPPPPIWALVTLALAVAFAAGIVLYFQLGTVGLYALAVATTGVLAALLVALSYRQSATLAELATLQRRQTALLERLAEAGVDVDLDADGGADAPSARPDAPPEGSDARVGAGRDPVGAGGDADARGEGGPGAPAIRSGGIAADGDRLRVDLRNDGDAPARDVRLVVETTVADGPLRGAVATTPLDRATPGSAGPGAQDGSNDADAPADPEPVTTGDGGTTTLRPGEGDRFVVTPSVAVADADGTRHAEPFATTVARLREAGVADAAVRVGLQHAGGGSGSDSDTDAAGGGSTADVDPVRRFLVARAIDPGGDPRPTLADVCGRG